MIEIEIVMEIEIDGDDRVNQKIRENVRKDDCFGTGRAKKKKYIYFHLKEFLSDEERTTSLSAFTCLQRLSCSGFPMTMMLPNLNVTSFGIFLDFSTSIQHISSFYLL